MLNLRLGNFSKIIPGYEFYYRIEFREAGVLGIAALTALFSALTETFDC